MTDTLHTLVRAFFAVLIISIFVRILLSWLPISPNNPVSRIVNIVAGPIMEPLQSRVPMVGMFNIAPLIALWGLWFVRALILFALPAGW